MAYRRTHAALGVIVSSALALCFVLGGCANGQTTTTDRPQSLARAQYHFSMTIAAGWAIQQEQEDPNANSPYSVIIGPKHPATSAAPSQFSLTVIKISTPGIVPNIDAIKSDPTYHVTTIGGQSAYVKVQVIPLPGSPPPTDQTVTPAATPASGAPGTVTHSDYEVPTGDYLFTIDTDAIAGQNADGALSSMIQSLSIQP
jgi:hypothetical protein